jgi:hypothetical protein
MVACCNCDYQWSLFTTLIEQSWTMVLSAIVWLKSCFKVWTALRATIHALFTVTTKRVKISSKAEYYLSKGPLKIDTCIASGDQDISLCFEVGACQHAAVKI